MDARILTLRNWGCDIDAAMERMLDDEEFYLECLNDIPDDPNFGQLTEALTKHDSAAAFDSAHTLKGVFANLGLTPMHNKIAEIVETLRTGKADGLSQKNAELLQMRGELVRILDSK